MPWIVSNQPSNILLLSLMQKRQQLPPLHNIEGIKKIQAWSQKLIPQVERALQLFWRWVIHWVSTSHLHPGFEINFFNHSQNLASV